MPTQVLSPQTTGFGFNPVLPKLETRTLADLKPLSFSAQAPVQFRAMPAFQIPSAHPELVAQDVESAVGSVSKGLQAAVEKALEQKNKKEIRAAELAEKLSEKKAEIQAKQEDPARQLLIDTRRLEKQKLENELQDRIEGVSSGAMKRAYDAGEFFRKSEKSQDATSPVEGIQSQSFDEDVEKLRSMKPLGQIDADSLDKINYTRDFTPSIFAKNLFSDLQQELPQTKTETEISEFVKNVAPSDLMASTDLGAAVVPSAVRSKPFDLTFAGDFQLPKTPKQIAAESQPPLPSQPMDIMPSVAPQVPVLAGLNFPATPTPATQPSQQAFAATPAPQQPSPTPAASEVPYYGLIYNPEIAQHEASKSYSGYQPKGKIIYHKDEYNPEASKMAGVPVKGVWQVQRDPLTASEIFNEQMRQQQLSDKTEKEIADRKTKWHRDVIAQSRAFNLQPSVKNFLKSGGVKEMLPPFFSAYEAAMAHPEAAGAAQVAMIDSYGRAEGGGKITVQQAHMIENATSLKDKWAIIKNRFGGGDVIGPDQMHQMARELVEAYNIGADSANKVVTATKRQLKGVGVPETMGQAYYFIGGHDPSEEVMLKSDATNRINKYRDEVVSLKAKIPTMNDEQKTEAQNRIQQLKSIAKILADRLKYESDTESSLLGAKAMRDKERLEGFAAMEEENPLQSAIDSAIQQSQ
jgi:hypothetical protein